MRDDRRDRERERERDRRERKPAGAAPLKTIIGSTTTGSGRVAMTNPALHSVNDSQWQLFVNSSKKRHVSPDRQAFEKIVAGLPAKKKRNEAHLSHTLDKLCKDKPHLIRNKHIRKAIFAAPEAIRPSSSDIYYSRYKIFCEDRNLPLPAEKTFAACQKHFLDLKLDFSDLEEWLSARLYGDAPSARKLKKKWGDKRCRMEHPRG